MTQERIALRSLNKRVALKHADHCLAVTDNALFLEEKGYQPVLYLPLADLPDGLLTPSDTSSHCPFKGQARYFHMRLENGTIEDAAWNYPVPIDGMERLATLVAFYPNKLQANNISLIEEVDGE